jgi:hypothetical protein
MWIDHVRFDNTYPPHQMYTHTIPLVDVVIVIVTTVVTFNACHMLNSLYIHLHYLITYMEIKYVEYRFRL